jgi:hypothetical protein
MASPGRVVLGSPQGLVKDCYAAAPKIDLTVRANGEELVKVMDSLGNFYFAGLEAPTAAAAVATSTPTGLFPNTDANYWTYRYVYVAKTAYPLVENAVTGGGSPAPRSNPSPASTIQVTVAGNAASAGKRVLTIPTSSRGDISHIWIYRTDVFLTSAEASDNSAAGNLSWIGEISNPSGVATVDFSDSYTVLYGADEQIENDNFVCPGFRNVIFVDPYFWGFGNDARQLNVSLTSTGVITAVSEQWYSGRNAQTITFAGITTGGYDNKGSYYFKLLTSTTAQVYGDLALSLPVGLPATGTTVGYFRGFSTTLYRSKPRNPFSWGDSTQVGDLLIPAPFAFSVGGGTGTAIAAIPNQNLLKLDTEGPNRCYTLNLKNAGTPNFEASLRIIADNYSVSTQFTQFSATLTNGQNVLWGIDTKSFAIVQCDGTEQRPISDMVYRTLRTMSLDADDRTFFHGFYNPRLELNCVLIKTQGSDTNNINVLVYHHAPTNYWGTIIVYDILCSATILDPFDGQQKIIVGTSTGYLGEMFAKDKFYNWFVPDLFQSNNSGTGLCDTNTNLNQVTSAGGIIFNYLSTLPSTFSAIPGVIGNWMTVIIGDAITPGLFHRYFCRINSIINSGTTVTFNYVLGFDVEGNLGPTDFPGIQFESATWYIGLIEIEVGRTHNAQIPFDYKKIQEFWSIWKYPDTTNIGPSAYPTLEWINNFIPDQPSGSREQTLSAYAIGQSTVLTPTSQAFTFSLQAGIPISNSKSFAFILRERSFAASQLISYEIRISETK